MSNSQFFKTEEASSLYIYLTSILIKSIDEHTKLISSSKCPSREKIELMLELSKFSMEQERENIGRCINTEIIYTSLKYSQQPSEKDVLN